MTTKKGGIEFQRDDYLWMLRNWYLIRDLIEGEQQLKDHDYYALNIFQTPNLRQRYGYEDSGYYNRNDPYLRQINPDDISDENRQRNAQYIKCAVLMNATRRTTNAMASMIFARKGMIEISGGIEYINKDADGNGMELWQQAKRVGRNVVAVGRHGLFVDFPRVEGGVTAVDVAGGARAYITEYAAENIINWQTERVGAVIRLKMVVLREYVNVSTGEFSTDQTVQYRALKLDENGLYTQEVRTYDADGEEKIEIIEPRDGSGQRMAFIPFVFVGSENNDQEIDFAPMLDIANVNIGHYRNSADVEENSFFAGQMTVTASGMTQQWIEDVWKGQAKVGSRSVLTGPEGASFGSIQASESNLARALMKDKENQMVLLGAKLIEPQQAQKTATQAQIDSADNASVLSVISGNIEDAYIMCLSWCQLFMNDNSDFQFELNRDFGLSKLSPQEITALVQALQAGAMSIDSVIWNMKKGQRLPKETEIEDEKTLIQNTELGLNGEIT